MCCVRFCRCGLCGEVLGDGTFCLGEDGKAYHSPCHKQRYHPRCCVCKDYIPSEVPSVQPHFRLHAMLHARLSLAAGKDSRTTQPFREVAQHYLACMVLHAMYAIRHEPVI